MFGEGVFDDEGMEIEFVGDFVDFFFVWVVEVDLVYVLVFLYLFECFV